MQSYFEGTAGLIITEDDVRRLLLHDQAARRLNTPKITRIARALITLILLLGLFYVLLNAPAFWIKSRFVVQTEVLPSKSIDQAPAALPVPGISVQNPVQEPTNPSLQDNHIYINRIKVNAPINWDIAGTDKDVLASLKSGVVQLAGTAHPGEKGNVFIVGHSSDYLTSNGKFKTVFTLLPNLKIGDLVTIMYHGVQYDYRVTDLKTVSPNDTSVLKNHGEAELNLMTCVPIGTKSKRFIVTAKPTKPALHTSTASLPSADQATDHLPGTQ